MGFRRVVQRAANGLLAPFGLELRRRGDQLPARVAELLSTPHGQRLVTQICGGMSAVSVEYPVNPKPRYGYRHPPHPEICAILDRGRASYQSLLRQFVQYTEWFSRIGRDEAPDSISPYWRNVWMPPLDAIALYSFLALKRPRRYFEIGSGHSTRFARRAITDHRLETEVVSIDPHPRAEIDSICDRVIRRPLEEVDLGIFGELGAGDILFFDGSHCCFMNSDVTVFFLEVLPRLRPGVLVQIHDIYLPLDYPEQRAWHHESEQYLLAVLLLGGGNLASVVLPNAFISTDAELTSLLDPIQRALGLPCHGGSFWLLKTDQTHTART